MSPPSLFGEIGILEGIPRTATVTAVGDCECLRIDGDDFLQALTSSPPSSSLMENASSRLALTHPSRRVTYAPGEAGRLPPQGHG
jgi:CRP-like cAMP-binding protein